MTTLEYSSPYNIQRSPQSHYCEEKGHILTLQASEEWDCERLSLTALCLLDCRNIASFKQGVKSKETVGNSWTIIEIILGHKYHHNTGGQIQGDSRKFMDHHRSYFGSQIPSQSLNEIHICQLQPKSTTKGDFFHIIINILVFHCQLFKSVHVALWRLT